MSLLKFILVDMKVLNCGEPFLVVPSIAEQNPSKIPEDSFHRRQIESPRYEALRPMYIRV